MSTTDLNIDGLGLDEAIAAHLKHLESTYRYTEYIEKGANGELVIARNRLTNQAVALKIYYWGGNRKLHAEPQTLQQLNSPYIIDVNHAEIIDDEWALFVTPFVEDGDLDALISSNSVTLHGALKAVRQILVGLGSLHGKNLVHRDLKPANILFAQGACQIADFGSVRRVPEKASHVTASGHSVLYRPPESFEGGQYSKVGDIYQVGVVLYQLLGGMLSYAGVDWLNSRELSRYESASDDFEKSKIVDQAICRRAKSERLIQIDTLHEWVPRDIRSAVRKAVRSDPTRRYQSAGEFVTEVHKLMSTHLDWQTGTGNTIGQAAAEDRHFRIVPDGRSWKVEQRVSKGWRKVPNSGNDEPSRLVALVDEKYC